MPVVAEEVLIILQEPVVVAVVALVPIHQPFQQHQEPIILVEVVEEECKLLVRQLLVVLAVMV
jgi:hypothetical protein